MTNNRRLAGMNDRERADSILANVLVGSAAKVHWGMESPGDAMLDMKRMLIEAYANEFAAIRQQERERIAAYVQSVVSNLGDYEDYEYRGEMLARQIREELYD